MDDRIFELHKLVLADGALSVRKKRCLLNEIRKVIPGEQNRWNFRWIVWTLALMALSVPAWLAWTRGSTIPPGLLSLASAAVGALAAFLAPHARQTEETSQTTPSVTRQALTPHQESASPNPPLEPTDRAGG